MVAGVTPGRGGARVLDRPVFNTVKDAVTATRADTSIVFVPPPFAADAIMEAADAGIRYCVCITDGIPIPGHDARQAVHAPLPGDQPDGADRAELRRHDHAGPGDAGHHARRTSTLPGRVGVIGRSGTLGYEAAAQLTALGIGVSTSVGIGGDPINGSSFRDHLGCSSTTPTPTPCS